MKYKNSNQKEFSLHQFLWQKKGKMWALKQIFKCWINLSSYCSQLQSLLSLRISLQYVSRTILLVPTKCPCFSSRSRFLFLLQVIDEGIFFQNDSAVIYWHGEHVWLVSTEKTGILINFQLMLIRIMDTLFQLNYAHQSFFHKLFSGEFF